MTPRLKKNRIVNRPPAVTGFNPTGSAVTNEKIVEIHFEEYEAFRLVDYIHLSHLEASVKMGVSRSTFTRIYDKVRKKIAKAFMEGLPIRVVGGHVDFKENWYRCKDCHSVFPLAGKTRECVECGSEETENLKKTVLDWQSSHERRKYFDGMNVYCICRSCNVRIKRQFGTACFPGFCPKCGKKMVRE